MIIKNFIVVFALLGFFTRVFGQDDVQSLGELPSDITETSGLLLFEGNLVTHNDSGNLAELYVLDVVGLEIVRKVVVENVPNNDWEDLAQDEGFIYIGDFGNNVGDRQNLTILRIAKNDFRNNEVVSAEQINFSYKDQVDFTTAPPQQTDWDAEALFVLGDNLVVLTKQWTSLGTVAYRIPKVPGEHIAEKLGTYQINGLVTGADFDTISNTLFICGYSRFLAPFFSEVNDLKEDSIFEGQKEKSSLAIGLSQIESIVKTSEGLLYCSSEAFTSTNPPISSASNLFRFTLNVHGGEASDSGESEQEAMPENEELAVETVSDALIVFKAFGSNQLNFSFNTQEPIFGVGIFDTSGRQVWYRPPEFIPTNTIDISALSPSVYFLSFQLRDSIFSRGFVKD